MTRLVSLPGVAASTAVLALSGCYSVRYRRGLERHRGAAWSAVVARCRLQIERCYGRQLGAVRRRCGRYF